MVGSTLTLTRISLIRISSLPSKGLYNIHPCFQLLIFLNPSNSSVSSRLVASAHHLNIGYIKYVCQFSLLKAQDKTGTTPASSLLDSRIRAKRRGKEREGRRKRREGVENCKKDGNLHFPLPPPLSFRATAAIPDAPFHVKPLY